MYSRAHIMSPYRLSVRDDVEYHTMTDSKQSRQTSTDPTKSIKIIWRSRPVNTGYIGIQHSSATDDTSRKHVSDLLDVLEEWAERAEEEA